MQESQAPSAGRRWREAMQAALYGENGFYLAPGTPGRHFRTSAHVSAGSAWVDAITELALRVAATLDPEATPTVVDVGAGDGGLLRGLAETLPEHFALIGVDLAGRPTGLSPRVRWQADLPTGICGLLIANEWLDVVPLDVGELTADGPRLVEVGADGDERLGSPLMGRELQWQRRWWPMTEVGDRAEIGSSRDDAWRNATGTIRQGLAVAIDYAAVPARDCGGTLTGHRAGRICLPVPDGSCDITAHVLFDSLLVPGDRLVSQREALKQLGADGSRPVWDGNPAGYLSQLSRATATAELIQPGGLGDFTWLLHAVRIPHPL